MKKPKVSLIFYPLFSFDDGSEGSSQGGLTTTQMQALTSYLEKRDKQSNEGGESQVKEEEDNEEEKPRRRRPNQNNQRRHRNRREYDLGGTKIKVLSFQGKSDIEAYFELKMCVDQIFSCQSYLEGKKVKLVALEFTNYALVWWDQMYKERARYGECPIRISEEMKAIMR
ncbi:hypothetical protein CR513_04870, partial [Mucuna pruriens]